MLVLRKQPYSMNEMIGRKIFMLRTLKYYSRSKLAQELCIGEQTIYKYEKGSAIISAVFLLKIANFFNVSITYFYEGIEETEQTKR